VQSVQNVECGMQDICGMQNAECGMQEARSRAERGGGKSEGNQSEQELR